MQLIKKHPLAVLATVIVMFLVFFGYRLFGESAKVVDVVLFTVFSAALLILPAMELGDEIMKLLRNMEPKASTASGSVNAIEPYRQRSQREDLEQSLVHALAPGLVSGMTGAEIGKYVRDAADAIMGSAQNRFVGQGACYAAKVHGYAAKVGDLSAKTANCTCGPADSCNNCPTPSAQADQYIESGMTFGAAIEALKVGQSVARAGWNGKGMFVYLVPAANYPAQTGAAKAYFGKDALVPYAAYLALKNVDGTVNTWAPSVSDALAEDWALAP